MQSYGSGPLAKQYGMLHFLRTVNVSRVARSMVAYISSIRGLAHGRENLSKVIPGQSTVLLTLLTANSSLPAHTTIPFRSGTSSQASWSSTHLQDTLIK